VHIDEASEPGRIDLIKLLFLNRLQELIVIEPSASWENAGGAVLNKTAVRGINAFKYFMIELQKIFSLLHSELADRRAVCP
jgi:hypothetical protein